jgi:hypothetical protein
MGAFDIQAMNAIQTRAIQLQSRKFRDQLIASPHAWPGGYPMFALCDDGGALCHRCCKTESRSIGTTYGRDGWAIVGLGVNWEDPGLFCDHCGERIESAYAEPDCN